MGSFLNNSISMLQYQRSQKRPPRPVRKRAPTTPNNHLVPSLKTAPKTLPGKGGTGLVIYHPHPQTVIRSTPGQSTRNRKSTPSTCEKGPPSCLTATCWYSKRPFIPIKSSRVIGCPVAKLWLLINYHLYQWL